MQTMMTGYDSNTSVSNDLFLHHKLEAQLLFKAVICFDGFVTGFVSQPFGRPLPPATTSFYLQNGTEHAECSLFIRIH
jgi:hypothetical protein